MDKDYIIIDDKTITSNPLLDEIIDKCKMIMNGIVLKDEEEANELETLESVKYADQYIACKESKMRFSDFSYNEDDLKAVGIEESLIKKYVINNSLIPIQYRNALLNNASISYCNSYEELNNYYRTLNGLPPISTLGVIVEPEDIPIELQDRVRVSIPIYQLSNTEIALLDSVGLIEYYKSQNPNAKYLNFLGDKRIDIYKARKARQFEALYVPQCGISQIQDKFEQILEKNRLLFIHTIYSDAYNIESEYYDKFIIVMIILQTFVDMIIEMPDYYIRRDLFDARTIQYLFEANGVEYYKEIPLKYQIALCRNLNRIIKFSSTDQNMIDICSLFGCKNIKIFKYYILKDRKISANDYVWLEDDNNYELKFLRVPIGEQYDNYIRSTENIQNYDDITNNDEYWDGDDSHEHVKSEILKLEFNVLRTKYYRIEAIYDITEMMFESAYFMNIFMNGNVDHSQLVFQIPFLSTTLKFNVVDVILFLYALGYTYNDSDDGIIYNQEDVLYIKGFNFDADMSVIQDYISTYDPNYAYTLEELGVAGFKIPQDKIITINQLMDIYTTNKAINEHLVKMMKEANDKTIYDIYKYLYDSLMVVQLNKEYMTDKNGNQAKTISDYLAAHSPILYNKLSEIKAIVDPETRRSTIANMTSNISDVLDNYLGTGEMDYIISSIPGITLDYIKEYLYKVINFFKSFKITMLPSTTMYVFADKYENTVFIIDRIIKMIWFHKTEMINIIDKLKLDTDLIAKTKLEIIEKLYTYICIYIEDGKREEIFIEDTIKEIIASKTVQDAVLIYDGFIEQYNNLYKTDIVNITEKYISSLVAYADDYWYLLEHIQTFHKNKISDYIQVLDNIYEYTITNIRSLKIDIKEKLELNTKLVENEYIKIQDIVRIKRYYEEKTS